MSVWDGLARGLGRRSGLWGALAAAAVSLSACGSVTSAGTAAPASTAAPAGSASQVRSAGGGALCARAGAVDRLVVSRASIPANHQSFSFPATVAVSDAARARAVAQALCALQPEQHGVACPIDLGVIYRLDFTAPGRNIPPVTIHAGGCEGVSGTGPSRWILGRPAFWTVLGQAMGLTNPSRTAFAGSMPS
jgi:hypothetical protein